MIEQTNRTWYVLRRAELLAEQFLLDLEPGSLSPMNNHDLGIDYMAFFKRPDGTPIVIAVEVKATQQPIKGRFIFPCSQAQRLLNMNIPVLIIVVDVKDSNVYFNWINEALSAEQKEMLALRHSCTVTLRDSTSEEREKLKQEILDVVCE